MCYTGWDAAGNGRRFPRARGHGFFFYRKGPLYIRKGAVNMDNHVTWNELIQFCMLLISLISLILLITR